MSSQPPKVALKSQRVALYNNSMLSRLHWDMKVHGDECNGEQLGISVRLGALSCTAPQGASPSLRHSPVGNLNHQGFISLVKAVPK